MSDVAVTWAKAQDCPTANAKQVLGCLATYADAEGDVWALVPVLAMESQSTDRTVQRALKGLKAAGLISLTGRNHVHRGKRVPIWRLHLDQGFASSRARLQAEARALLAMIRLRRRSDAWRAMPRGALKRVWRAELDLLIRRARARVPS